MCLPSPMPAPEPRRPSILLAEDDVGLARTLAEYLERQGYTVLHAKDGREATKVLMRQRVDLLISDIYMPEGDGIELLTLVRRCTPAPAVVAMSGAGLGRIEGMLKMASVLGAARTLAKPFSLQQLLGLVRELVGPAPAAAG